MKILFYCATAFVDLIQWEEETVVYNHGSACTHLISGISIEMLDLIFSGNAFSNTELSTLIQTASPKLAADVVNSALQSTITQLLRLELIEVVDV